MRRSRIIVIPALVLIVAVLITAVLSRGTEVRVIIPDEYTLSDMVVKLGEVTLEPSGSGGRTYSARTSPGEKVVTISSPTYATYSEEVDIDLFSRTTISPQLEPITARDVAAVTVSLDGYDIFQEKLFGTNWAVFIAAPKNTPQSEALIVVAEQDTENREWVVREEGTSILTDALNDAPPELIEYVGRL